MAGSLTFREQNLSTIGNSNKLVTLSAKHPDVTITGTVNAYGTVAGVPLDAAVYGPAGTKFDLTNNGDVISPGAAATDNGILFLGTGAITNNGTIEAGSGISILGTAKGALVENSGDITATYGNGVYLHGKGDVINTGKITAKTGAGISLASGGRVANYGLVNAATGLSLQNGGYLYNGGSIHASDVGIVAASSSAAQITIYNFGGVTAGTLGVALLASGYLYNAGTIAGQYGVELVSTTSQAAGLVTNTGLIKGVGTHGVGLITEYAYDRNAGIIKSGYLGALIEGAALYNTGTINAPSAGVFAIDGAVYNYGTIIQSGSVDLIQYGIPQVAVEVIGTSALYNGPTGRISGTNIGLASSGTAANYGLISGGEIGVLSAGPLYNAGTILGGVEFYGATFTNAGILRGNASFAISVVSSMAAGSELLIEAGSEIDGAVTLGGAALEIDAGRQTVTIAASQFSGIGDVTVHARSHAEFAGSLGIGGLANAGLVTEAKGTNLTIAGPLTGQGTIDIGAKSAITLAGTAAAAQTLAFSGTAETLAIATAAGFAATVQNFAAGDTIDLTGVSLASIDSATFGTGVLIITAAGGTYDVTFASTASFKNETFATFAEGDGTGITLASTAKMNFVAPAWTPSATTLPALATVYTPKAASAAPPPASTVTQAGWLGQTMLPGATPVPAVTLHA